MIAVYAHSFRRKSLLAVSLSWVAGYTNVIALIYAAQTISHMTGDTTLLGRALAGPTLPGALRAIVTSGFIVGAFLVGAMSAGLAISRAQRHNLASQYVPPILLEIILLTVYSIGLARWIHLGQQGAAPIALVGLGAMAMGLQNATITRISGAVVRTTHVTGVVTDLGLEIVAVAQWWNEASNGNGWRRRRRLLKLARRQHSVLRTFLLACIYGSFLLGVILGTLAFRSVPAFAMAAPILFLLFVVWRTFTTLRGSIERIDPATDEELRRLGIGADLIPRTLELYRVVAPDRRAEWSSPDFSRWADGIHARVVVLCMHAGTHFDEEALASLSSCMTALKSRGQRAVLSGISQPQFKRIHGAEGLSQLSPHDLTPDLEFAIARAHYLLET